MLASYVAVAVAAFAFGWALRSLVAYRREQWKKRVATEDRRFDELLPRP
jgi:hypothetical protein